MVHLTTEVALALDILAWLVIQAGASYLTWRMPAAAFAGDGTLYRIRDWEREGLLYSRLVGVKRWKRLLPDGAPVFPGGFSKRHLASAKAAYLATFLAETRRAELGHWLAIFLTPAFFVWNEWYVAALMIPYALAVNLPCIVTQRYNRARLARVLRHYGPMGYPPNSKTASRIAR